MRRSIEKEEGFTDGEIVEKWSVKKISIGILVLIALFGFAVFAFLNIQKKATQVLSARVNTQNNLKSENVKLPSKEDAQELLESAKNELSKITSDNFSASGSALQKVISDLQKVQKGDKTPISAFCEMVCEEK